MYLRIALVWACCVVWIFGPAQSRERTIQNYLSELYLPERGLPVTNVNQFYQTPDGFLWMATYNGLVRFDGLKYRQYTVANTGDLVSNRLVTIQPGQGNCFWLSTEQGHLIRFEDDQLQTFGPFPQADHQKVFLDGDSITWVIANYGLARMSDKNMVFFQPEEFQNDPISAVFRKKNGALVLGFESGSVRNTFHPYQTFTELSNLTNEDLPKLFFETKNEELYHANTSFLNVSTKHFSRFENDDIVYKGWTGTPPLYYAINETSDGGILIRAETGLYQLKDNRIQPIKIDETPKIPGESERLGASTCKCQNGDVWTYVNREVYKNGSFEFEAHKEPTSIFCDRENSLWLSLSGKGIQRFRRSPIYVYRSSSGKDNFYGVYEDARQNIWIGEWFKNLFVITADSLQPIKTSKNSGSTAAFLETSDGRFLVGNRIGRLEGESPPQSLAQFKSIPEIENEVHAIYEASDKSIWFGARSNLYRMRGDSISRVSPPSEYHTVRYFLETRNKHLLMATNGDGVYSYNLNTEEWEKTVGFNEGLASNNIRSLWEDPKGYIWVATEDAGLNRYHPQTKEISHIDIGGGLYNNGIHTLMVDEDQRLWMSTNEGIFYVPIDQLNAYFEGGISQVESIIFTERDGMKNRETNGGFQNAVLKDSKGALWYPTQEGAISINPKSALIKSAALHLNITDVFSDDSLLSAAEDHYRLGSEQKNLRIAFSAPTFITPKQINYRYRLKPFEEEWHVARESREAVFTNLPAGEYIFEVEAYHRSEAKPIGFASVSVTKLPTLFESAWFKLLIALFLLLTIGLAFRIRTKKLLKRQMELREEVALRTHELQLEKEITEKQKEELIQLDREKNNFFANISHEFRTPLTLILAPLQDMLKGEEPISESNQKRLARAIQNSKRMQVLVEQLLDLAQLQSGKMPMTFRSGDFIAFLRSISTHYQSLAEQREITFLTDFPKGVIRVRFDDKYLDKVFHNLLSNAFKFTAKGGSIKLSLTNSGDTATVRISDTGVGIDPKHLNKLFDRFYQVEKSELQPGSGIGLSIAKEITELHGGSISVESTPGKGSIFNLCLPILSMPPNEERALSTEQSKMRAAVAEATFADAAIHEKRILIVDDHEEIRKFIGEAFQGLAQVTLSASGNEALKKCKQSLPDLIISDVVMPDGDGFFLLKSIRKTPDLAHIPVILLTAKAQIEDKLQGLGIGADDYITKPFHTEELKARVKAAFERQFRLKRYFQSLESKKGFQPILFEGSSADDKWLTELRSILEKRISDPTLSIEDIAEDLSISRSSLYRKTTKLMEETPKDLLLRLRMERAKTCLDNQMGTVSEIGYSCGFSSLAHFSKTFKQYFGMSPSQYPAAVSEEPLRL